MSRKHKVILLVLVAGIGASWLVLPRLSARGKIAFGLKSYARGSAVFMITNTSRVPVDYTVTVEHKDYSGWPNYLGKVLPHAPPEGCASPCRIAPGQVSACTVGVMVYAPPCPWRLSVRHDSMSAFDRLRERGSALLLEYGMYALADKLWPGKYFAIVTGPEMEQ